MTASSMDDAIADDGEFVLSPLAQAELLMNALGEDAPELPRPGASAVLYDADGTETNGDLPKLIYIN